MIYFSLYQYFALSISHYLAKETQQRGARRVVLAVCGGWLVETENKLGVLGVWRWDMMVGGLGSDGHREGI